MQQNGESRRSGSSYFYVSSGRGWQQCLPSSPHGQKGTCGHLGTQGEEMAPPQLVLLHDLGFSSWLVALSSDTLGFPIPFKIKCLF